MPQILKDFQKKMNSDLSVSGIQGVEKAGVFVVTSASSCSHRCLLPGFWYL